MEWREVIKLAVVGTICCHVSIVSMCYGYIKRSNEHTGRRGDDMMKRKYVQLSKAWYGDYSLRNADYVEEVSFGYYDTDGSTDGELFVRWYPSPINGARLEVFDDSFKALHECIDVIEELRYMEELSVEEFIDILESKGFTNNTKTERD